MVWSLPAPRPPQPVSVPEPPPRDPLDQGGGAGAGWGHPGHSAPGEKGALGCARTRPRASNHPQPPFLFFFWLFTHFLSRIPRHSPSLQLLGDFSHRRTNRTISHAGKRRPSLAPRHVPTPSLRPSPSPSSSSPARGCPSSQRGGPNSQPQPRATSPKPWGSSALPGATLGWWDGAGAEGIQETHVNMLAYKYSSKLSAVYPEPLFWRWVLAEQTPGSAAG